MLEAGHLALFDSAMRCVGFERMQTCGLPDEPAPFADHVVDTRTSLEVRRQRRKDEKSRRERTVCKEGESAFDTAKADVRLEPQHLEEDKHVLRSSTRAREREALSLLQLFQRDQFLFSTQFCSLEDALEHGPGVLDLFSGSRGLARALCVPPCWVLCFDISHFSEADLLHRPLRLQLIKLVSEGFCAAMAAGPVCASFSMAITPPCRTPEFLAGVP